MHASPLPWRRRVVRTALLALLITAAVRVTKTDSTRWWRSGQQRGAVLDNLLVKTLDRSHGRLVEILRTTKEVMHELLGQVLEDARFLATGRTRPRTRLGAGVKGR